MPIRRVRRRGALAILSLAVMIGSWFLWFSDVTWVNVVGAGLLGAAVTFGSWLTLRRGPGEESVPPEVLNAASVYLRRAGRAYWEDEARARGITAPIPAAVRWTWAAPDLAAPFEDVTGGVEVFSAGVVTELGNLLYGQLPDDRARVVIVGSPGSGKTGALLLLLLHTLAEDVSARQDPVPVLLSLGRWNPAKTSLFDWVAAEVARNFPGVQNGPWDGPRVCRALLSGRYLALFLDGLDEMWQPHPYFAGPCGRRGQRQASSRGPVAAVPDRPGLCDRACAAR